MDMQKHIEQFFEACLIYNEKEWVRETPFTNYIYYHIRKGGGFLLKSWIKLEFAAGNADGGYCSVSASFPFEEATNKQKDSMMAYYMMPAEMLHLKRTLKEVAKIG
jgi:hypothetical protein